jgi:hypothetical protein
MVAGAGKYGTVPRIAPDRSAPCTSLITFRRICWHRLGKAVMIEEAPAKMLDLVSKASWLGALRRTGERDIFIRYNIR